MFRYLPLLAGTYFQDQGKDLHSVSEPTTGHYSFSLRITVGLQSLLQILDLTSENYFGISLTCRQDKPCKVRFVFSF